jgi:hypothetical protein
MTTRDKLTPEQLAAIRKIWTTLEDTTDGDLSTEMLFALTAEQATKALGREVDEGDVSAALAEEREKPPPPRPRTTTASLGTYEEQMRDAGRGHLVRDR